jgi:hypothetical protein
VHRYNFSTIFRIILDIHIVHFIYTTFMILLFKFNICYIIVINVTLLTYLKTNDNCLIFLCAIFRALKLVEPFNLGSFSF